MKYTSKKKWFSLSKFLPVNPCFTYRIYIFVFFSAQCVASTCAPTPPARPVHCRDRCGINTLWMCSRLVRRDPAPAALLGFRWAGPFFFRAVIPADWFAVPSGCHILPIPPPNFPHTLLVTEASCRPSSATHRLLLCCIFWLVPLLHCTEMKKKNKKRERENFQEWSATEILSPQLEGKENNFHRFVFITNQY